MGKEEVFLGIFGTEKCCYKVCLIVEQSNRLLRSTGVFLGELLLSSAASVLPDSRILLQREHIVHSPKQLCDLGLVIMQNKGPATFYTLGSGLKNTCPPAKNVRTKSGEISKKSIKLPPQKYQPLAPKYQPLA